MVGGGQFLPMKCYWSSSGGWCVGVGGGSGLRPSHPDPSPTSSNPPKPPGACSLRDPQTHFSRLLSGRLSSPFLLRLHNKVANRVHSRHLPKCAVSGGVGQAGIWPRMPRTHLSPLPCTPAAASSQPCKQKQTGTCQTGRVTGQRPPWPLGSVS